MKVAEIIQTGVRTVPIDTSVRDIMTPRPLMIEATAEVSEAARHMLYADVRRLFVEEDGSLAGVVSQTDIVQAVASGELT